MKSKFKMRSELIKRLAGQNPELAALTMRNFERMTFTDDADFDNYLNELKPVPETPQEATPQEIDKLCKAMGLDRAEEPKKPAPDADIEEVLKSIM